LIGQIGFTWPLHAVLKIGERITLNWSTGLTYVFPCFSDDGGV
jgi:hypothetical protein